MALAPSAPILLPVKKKQQQQQQQQQHTHTVSLHFLSPLFASFLPSLSFSPYRRYQVWSVEDTPRRWLLLHHPQSCCLSKRSNNNNSNSNSTHTVSLRFYLPPFFYNNSTRHIQQHQSAESLDGVVQFLAPLVLLSVRVEERRDGQHLHLVSTTPLKPFQQFLCGTSPAEGSHRQVQLENTQKSEEQQRKKHNML